MASRYSSRYLAVSLVAATVALSIGIGFLVVASSVGSQTSMQDAVPSPLPSQPVLQPPQLEVGTSNPSPTLDATDATDTSSDRVLFDRSAGQTEYLSREGLATTPVEHDTALWKWVAIAFTTVFVAEMGDKTQLATVLMSAQGKSPWTVFCGSASALVAASIVSVTLGDWLSRFLPPNVLQLVAGISFVAIGIYVIWEELTSDCDPADDIPQI